MNSGLNWGLIHKEIIWIILQTSKVLDWVLNLSIDP